MPERTDANSDNHHMAIEGELPPSPQGLDLTERQSTRTTFKMRKAAYQAAARLAKRGHITLRDLLHDICVRIDPGEPLGDVFLPSVLGSARKSQAADDAERRTQVVTKGTLRRLNRISANHAVDRDRLLEAAILLFDLMDRAQVCMTRAKLKEMKEKTEEFMSYACDYDRYITESFDEVGIDYTGEYTYAAAATDDALFLINDLWSSLGFTDDSCKTAEGEEGVPGGEETVDEEAAR